MKYPKLHIIKKDTPQEHVIEIDEANIVPIPRFEKLGNPYIDNRGAGEFAGSAIYLDVQFDWILGKDNDGSTILVALKK